MGMTPGVDAPKLKRWQKYAVAIAAGALMGVAFAYLLGAGTAETQSLVMRCFSDGFFIASILMIGFGGLMWVSTTGFFDIFSYGAKSLLVLFSSLRHPKNHPKYYDYKTEKEARRGKAKPYLFVAGLFCLAVSGIALALYYNL